MPCKHLWCNNYAYVAGLWQYIFPNVFGVTFPILADLYEWGKDEPLNNSASR